MRFILFAILLLTVPVIASNPIFPPTTSKVSGDTKPITTFNYDFSAFTGSHSGTTVTVNGAAGSGVTTVGGFSTGSIPNGAVINGTTITFGPADGTNPGMISESAQTMGSGIKTFSSAINMGSNKINSVTDPTSSQDAATKNYVDTQLNQLNPAAAVFAASTVNIPGTYTNAVGGVCIGDTFQTTSTTQPFVIDGATPAVGSRILLKNQNSAFQDGVWILTTQAVAAVSGAIFTRALDYDSAADFNAGQIIPIINGTVNASTSWYQTAVITTCSSDSQTYVKFTSAAISYPVSVANGGTGLSSISNGNLLYANGANVLAGLTTANSATLITDSNGNPSISQTLPTAVQTNITNLGTISNAAAIWNGGSTYYHALLTSGTTSWTAPTQFGASTVCHMNILGSGGSGAGATNSANTPGGGGGAAGLCSVYSTVTANTAYTVKIGASVLSVSGGSGLPGLDSFMIIAGTDYVSFAGGSGTTGFASPGGTGGTFSSNCGAESFIGQAGGGTPASAGAGATMAGLGGSTIMGSGGTIPMHTGAGSTNGFQGTGFGAGGSGSIGATAGVTVSTGGSSAPGVIKIDCWN